MYPFVPLPIVAARPWSLSRRCLLEGFLSGGLSGQRQLYGVVDYSGCLGPCLTQLACPRAGCSHLLGEGGHLRDPADVFLRQGGLCRNGEARFGEGQLILVIADALNELGGLGLLGFIAGDR